jgi:hypothetical protein
MHIRPITYLPGKRIVLPHWLQAIAMGVLMCIGINLLIKSPLLAAVIVAICFLPTLIVRSIWFVRCRRDHSIIKGKVVNETIPWRTRVLRAWNKSRVYTFESLMFMVVVILLNAIWVF